MERTRSFFNVHPTLNEIENASWVISILFKKLNLGVFVCHFQGLVLYTEVVQKYQNYYLHTQQNLNRCFNVQTMFKINPEPCFFVKVNNCITNKPTLAILSKNFNTNTLNPGNMVAHSFEV